MIVHKLSRFIFEFDKAAGPGKITFEELVKQISKLTTEEREIYLAGGTLDEETKAEIADMTEAGLI